MTKPHLPSFIVGVIIAFFIAFAWSLDNNKPNPDITSCGSQKIYCTKPVKIYYERTTTNSKTPAIQA